MAELPDGLLSAVKSYLNVTWQDEATDAKITGYISRGMARLQNIAGAPLDFITEGQPRALLLDYCRYANAQALEVFEKNFMSELLELNLCTQAPVIDGLTVILTASGGGTRAAAAPTPAAGNSYMYRVGDALELPGRLDICAPGDWSCWDGISDIPAERGQDVVIVEVNDGYKAERAGKATV